MERDASSVVEIVQMESHVTMQQVCVPRDACRDTLEKGVTKVGHGSTGVSLEFNSFGFLVQELKYIFSFIF